MEWSNMTDKSMNNNDINKEVSSDSTNNVKIRTDNTNEEASVTSSTESNNNYMYKNNYIGQNNETRDRKIFVGGLGWNTDDATLYQYFVQFGEIEEAVVIRERESGKSRGYGFVTFRSNESANKAVVYNRPVIDGRKTNCNLAYRGTSKRNKKSARGRSLRRSYRRNSNNSNSNITNNNMYMSNQHLGDGVPITMDEQTQFAPAYFYQAPFPPQQLVYPQQYFTAPTPYYAQAVPNQFVMSQFSQEQQQALLQQALLQQQQQQQFVPQLVFVEQKYLDNQQNVQNFGAPNFSDDTVQNEPSMDSNNNVDLTPHSPSSNNNDENG